jgi:hypothetical protein
VRGRHFGTPSGSRLGEVWTRASRTRTRHAASCTKRSGAAICAAPDEFDAVVIDPGIEPIVGSAWFNAHELRALDETVYPEGLAQLVEEVS